jgi:hypothetical protein
MQRRRHHPHEDEAHASLGSIDKQPIYRPCSRFLLQSGEIKYRTQIKGL